MSRGKQLHTQLKKDAVKVAIVELAKLKAEMQFRNKQKPMDKVENFVFKLLDKLDGEDIIKLVAVGTISYLIYPTVKTIPQVINYQLEHPASGMLQQFANSIVLLIQPPYEVSKMPSSDLTAIILSIGIASLIVISGPSILQSVGGIGKFVGLLFA